MLRRHFEAEDIKFDSVGSHAVTTGLSIGLFSAAAVSVSESLEELVHYGVESVRLAFRLGDHVYQFSEHLDPRSQDTASESWAYVVIGLSTDTIQSEIDHYNEATVSSEGAGVVRLADKTQQNTDLTKIFISASDSGSVNVTGPPARLKDFFKRSAMLRTSRFYPLPVHEGLCHGGHLFSTEDFEAVVDADHSLVDRTQPVKMRMFSSANGRPFQANSLQGLQIELVSELMTSSVHLDAMKEGLADHFGEAGIDQCDLFSCGECQVFKSLVAGIALDSFATKVSTIDLTAWSKNMKEPRIPRSFKESKLAVVGMSCRLPGGADDNELFWKLMVDGRDTLTTVPADRFDLDTHYDPTGNTPNATQTPYGNFIDKPGLFDPQFFNMSPREVSIGTPATNNPRSTTDTIEIGRADRSSPTFSPCNRLRGS